MIDSRTFRASILRCGDSSLHLWEGEMSVSGSRVLAFLAGALMLRVSHAGAATLTVTSSVGGAPTGISYVNFDNLTLGSGGGTSVGVTVSRSAHRTAGVVVAEVVGA